MDNNNEETLDFSIDDLFKDPEEDSQIDTKSEEKSDESDSMTKAVSERINTVRKKTESETQDKVAKELGYENYADLQKANEKKLLKDAGLDEEDITGVVNKLVEQRIANDPRFKKIEELEAIERNNFVTSQLKEINKITGNNYTSVDQLPKETLEMWEKIGNLTQAYYATQGAQLFNKGQSINKKGSLSHLADGNNGPSSSKKRPLTDEEKAIYRMVNPDLTEEELAKKTRDVDD
jgi:hypothetical protein